MQDESIYNLIPREYQAPEKSQRHTSKFREKVKDDEKATKAASKGMGPAKVALRNPQNFLKKGEGEQRTPQTSEESQPFKYPDSAHRKPPVPRRDEAPVHGIRTNKNFITQNAMETIMSVPKNPQKQYVDTKKGDTQNLLTSGMEPNFVHKKDFGKTPTYLESRKKEIARAQDEYNQHIRDHFRQGTMQQLSEQERCEILAGLKSNWEQIHHEYQGLSVVTDTAPKRARKERMESEMKQLERDIETMEKHRIIYIAN